MDWLFWRAYFRIKAIHNIDMSNARYATYQLGKLYRMQYPNSKEKAFKLGVRKIYDYLDHKISKRQIKKFLNCSCSKYDCIYIPYESNTIFNVLVKLVDEHPNVKQACRSQCKNCVNSAKSPFCRDKIIGDFYELIIKIYDDLPERAKERLYIPMMTNTKRCD